MPIPDWIKTHEWDVLHLGNYVVPGVAMITAKMDSGLDVRKPKGAKGAKVKDVGAPPAELEIEIMVLPDEIDAFKTTIDLVRPPTPGQARITLPINHPMARLLGVHVVMLGEVRIQPPQAGGPLFATIKAYQWVKPEAAEQKSPRKQGDDGWDVEAELNKLKLSTNGAAEKNYSGSFDD